MRNIKNMKKMGKKGVETYISWVLLIALAITTSIFMYVWTTSSVESSMEYVIESDNKGICQDVGISLVNVCQNAQTLNMNVSSTNIQGISGLKFQFIDIYDNVESRSRNISIRPNELKEMEVIKQGTIKQVEITPVITTNNQIITCIKRMISVENIRVC